MNFEKLIKILLAILFFLCLINMPYGFYQFVRLCAVVGFSILAYHAYIKDKKIEVIVFIALGLLFQPFFKIALGSELLKFFENERKWGIQIKK